MASKELLLAYALSFLGVPYRWGGNNPLTGLDCSGLVCEILKGHGVVPHSMDATSQQLFNMFGDSSVSPQLGALAFYGKSKDEITHVAFCLNDRLIVEAGSGNHNVTDLSEAQAKGAVVRIRPLNYRRDLVSVLMPVY